MAHTRAIGEVDELVTRDGDDGDDRLVAVANGQRHGDAKPVGELAQDGVGFLLEARLHTAGQLDQPGAEDVASVGQAPDEMVIGERREQAVHGGSVRPERVGEFGNGDPVGLPVQDRQGSQPAVEGQGMRGRRRFSGVGSRQRAQRTRLRSEQMRCILFK